jgi:integrase/recombinase XerD
MLAEIYPRYHARYRSLPVLGPYLDGFVEWLRSEGYPSLPIRLRVRAAGVLDAELRARSVSEIGQLTGAELIEYGPKDSRDDVYRSAVVRSLASYLGKLGALAPSPETRSVSLIAAYRRYLECVRGLATSTVSYHASTVAELLAFIGYEDDPERLSTICHGDIERFIESLGRVHCRGSLQHDVGHLRSFLRYLAARGIIEVELAERIDTPRLYRDERLPRSVPWTTVRGLLGSIDRSCPMGRRDYAMLLLMATYGLRSCEVVALTLDDIDWHAERLRVRRPKVQGSLELPLTPQVGAAIINYVRDGRPDLASREVFLRVRSPAGTLKPTALTEVFQGCVRRSGLPIPFQGPHCLRHSVAVHLLRQGASLKEIGDLLGHRSPESTCVYLRLQLEDLREVALPIPAAATRPVQR